MLGSSFCAVLQLVHLDRSQGFSKVNVIRTLSKARCKRKALFVRTPLSRWVDHKEHDSKESRVVRGTYAACRQRWSDRPFVLTYSYTSKEFAGYQALLRFLRALLLTGLQQQRYGLGTGRLGKLRGDDLRTGVSQGVSSHSHRPQSAH